MTAPNYEQVLAKVKKLLALAENNSNPHEAAAAAARAQELMTRYSIDAAAVAAETGEADASLGGMTTEEIHTKASVVPIWMRVVADAVARVNACELLYRSTRGGAKVPGKLLLVGRERDVRLASYLLQWLFREVARLLQVRQQRAPMGQRWANSFRMGAATAIRERLFESQRMQRRKLEVEAVREGRGIAVVTRALAELDLRREEARAHAERAFDVRERKSTTSEVDAHGFLAGIRDGARVPIASQAVAELGHSEVPC